MSSNYEVLYDQVITTTEVRAVIDAPADTVDVADWLLNLPDPEYQRCAPGEHIACGSSVTDDGRPISINVENVGGLIVQHYVAEIHEPHHCHMVSLSDVQTPAGWTKNHVIWDLRIEPLGENRSELVNTVIVRPTQAMVDLIVAGGGTLEEAAAQRQTTITGHNERETPLFAQSIARHASARAAAAEGGSRDG